MRKNSLFSAMLSAAQRVLPFTLVLCGVCTVFTISLAAQNTKPLVTEAKYVGPGSCAATACHGSVKPVVESRIFQNEYSTWILKDKHARA